MKAGAPGRPRPEASPAVDRRLPLGAAAAVLGLAALLRLALPGLSPPGLNQDEAVNAWNAWCLLHTGADMNGRPWPVFYSHAIGDNRTTLMYYAMLPALASFGLEVWTLRLPAALAGIAAVAIAMGIATRGFGRRAGLATGLLMAINPWAVFLSRWGIEGSLCPVLALGTVALLDRGGLIRFGPSERMRTGWALAAGLFAGMACYGYWAMRLWVAALFLALMALEGRRWWRALASGEGRRAVLAFCGGLAVTAGPLLGRHLTDPEIARRAGMTRLLPEGAPPLATIPAVISRWIEHFGPDFLFVRGDRYELLALPGAGAFLPFSILFLGFGLVTLAGRLRRDPASRWLLALLVLYPAGDLMARYDGVHMLRSAPGVGALVMLEGLGGAASVAWLVRRGRAGGVAMSAVGVLVALVASLYFVRFYGEWNARREVWLGYQADLLEAARWIAPRLSDTDRVFVTMVGLNQPFAIVRVALVSDPATWRREPADVRTPADWDLRVRDGKFVYLYGQLAQPHYDELARNGSSDRILFVTRPGELGFSRPVKQIRSPRGEVTLEIFEMTR